MSNVLGLDEEKVVKKVTYPVIEEMTFKAYITSESQGMELLTCIQAIVNAVGADIIIQSVRAIEKDPSILQKAKTALPLLKLI